MEEEEEEEDEEDGKDTTKREIKKEGIAPEKQRGQRDKETRMGSGATKKEEALRVSSGRRAAKQQEEKEGEEVEVFYPAAVVTSTSL